MTGVGLFYREGYFRQVVDGEGRQTESYPVLEPDELPLSIAEPPDGSPPVVSVNLAGRNVNLLIRLARVGRVPRPAARLEPAGERAARPRGHGPALRRRPRDAAPAGDRSRHRRLARAREGPAVADHPPHQRGPRRLRLAREDPPLRAGRASDLRGGPRSGHERQRLHDAHARAGGDRRLHAGASLEVLRFLRRRARHLLRRVLRPRPRGRERTAGSSSRWRSSRCGSRRTRTPSRSCTARCRASSGATSRPICRSPRSRSCRSRTACTRRPGPRPRSRRRASSEAPEAVDRTELWQAHEALRAKLVAACREKLVEEKRRQGAREEEIAEAGRALDPKALTIGFARRFATYKRATLLFREPKRLEYLLHQIGRPVQILFAGKAHPRDEAGKEYLRAVSVAAARPEFRGRVVLPVGLRHGSGPAARRGLRRLAEYARAAARGVRNLGHEGRDERRSQPLGPRRMVGRGAARRGRVRRGGGRRPRAGGGDRPRSLRHAREARPPDVLRPRRHRARPSAGSTA